MLASCSEPKTLLRWALSKRSLPCVGFCGAGSGGGGIKLVLKVAPPSFLLTHASLEELEEELDEDNIVPCVHSTRITTVNFTVNLAVTFL